MNMQNAVKRSQLQKGDGSLIRHMGQSSIHRSSLAGDSTVKEWKVLPSVPGGSGYGRPIDAKANGDTAGQASHR